LLNQIQSRNIRGLQPHLQYRDCHLPH
jgi:hypothetical protein